MQSYVESMDFFLHKEMFNTPFHFKCSTETFKFEKCENLQEDSCVITNSSEEFDDIFSLFNFEKPSFPENRFKKPFSYIGTSKEKIPWHLVLPKDIYKHQIIDCVRKYIKFFKETNLNYYNEFYKPIESIFDNIKPACIDVKKFYSYLQDQNDLTDKSHLKTFAPYGEFAESAKYTRLHSKTGRLSHINGPSILHLQKKYRDIIVSRFGDEGKIYYLDYSSLEPRVLLALNNKFNCPQDIYSTILNDLNINIDRSVIKTIILSRIYGSSDQVITNKIQDQVKYPQDLIDLIDEYFCIDQFKENLLSEFIKNDCKSINNFYGKPIWCTDGDQYKLLNYYIQSTSVDVAMLGFLKIIKKIIKLNLLDKIVPIFLIHDAIVFDIHNEYQGLVEKMCTLGSNNIKKFEQVNFFLKNEG